MKQCSSCAKPAIFHVTLLQQGDVKELHFCENHFGEYMNNSDKSSKGNSLEDDFTPFIGESAPDDTITDNTAEHVEDDLICPQCGISYQEFRKLGRFGCAHDYVVFHNKLYKLFENIHNETSHHGKIPKHSIDGGEKQYLLLQKKRELSRAIDEERYEDAASLRDEISKLESKLGELST